MKIKVKKLPYEEVAILKPSIRKSPCRPSKILKLLIRLISKNELKNVNFTYEFEDKKLLGKTPCLILMNHSSFLDLKMVAEIFKNRDYNIISTSDSLVGKELLMRKIGCIPTQKFVHDITLIKDMKYALEKLKTSVLMYPEAGYSLDGTNTPIPENFGKLIKMLNVPVVFIKSFGAFHYDPLYNCLQRRKVNVSCKVSVLATKEQVKTFSVDELTKIVNDAFTFDNFKWQFDNGVQITEPFRAKGIERALYKCPNCNAEGKTVGNGVEIKCNNCGKSYALTELGTLKANSGETEFSSVPDWYKWEREEVKKEIENGSYKIETKVRIMMLVNYKCLYEVGYGYLTHNQNGFYLEGDGFPLKYHQGVLSCYTLNSDYYWYEIGDVISIGDKSCLYYCFPEKEGVVTKLRLATEELYKIAKENLKK